MTSLNKYHSDQNDIVSYVIELLGDDANLYCTNCLEEFEYDTDNCDCLESENYHCKYTCKNCEYDECAFRSPISTDTYRAFKKLIDLKTLSTYDPEIIIGVLISLAKTNYNEFPIKLPPKYPQEYRILAITTFIRWEYNNFQELTHWKYPHGRLNIIYKEKSLFFGNIDDKLIFSNSKSERLQSEIIEKKYEFLTIV